MALHIAHVIIELMVNLKLKVEIVSLTFEGMGGTKIKARIQEIDVTLFTQYIAVQLISIGIKTAATICVHVCS